MLLVRPVSCCLAEEDTGGRQFRMDRGTRRSNLSSSPQGSVPGDVPASLPSPSPYYSTVHSHTQLLPLSPRIVESQWFHINLPQKASELCELACMQVSGIGSATASSFYSSLCSVTMDRLLHHNDRLTPCVSSLKTVAGAIFSLGPSDLPSYTNKDQPNLRRHCHK